MQEQLLNTQENQIEYVDELRDTDRDMVIYRMIGELANKLLISNI